MATIRKMLDTWLPLIVPEVGNSVFYQYIPEDVSSLPALAYLIADEFQDVDLEANVYTSSCTVRFGIVANDVLEVDRIKCKLLSLCGVGKLPGVQYIKLADAGDADADLTIEQHMSGYEMALILNL